MWDKNRMFAAYTCQGNYMDWHLDLGHSSTQFRNVLSMNRRRVLLVQCILFCEWHRSGSPLYYLPPSTGQDAHGELTFVNIWYSLLLWIVYRKTSPTFVTYSSVSTHSSHILPCKYLYKYKRDRKTNRDRTSPDQLTVAFHFFGIDFIHAFTFMR